MARWGILVVAVAAALTAPACRKKQQIAVDTSEAKDIPREIALQKLQELLPTAEYFASSVPKESYKAADVKEVRVTATGLEVIPFSAKDKTLVLSYGDMTEVRLDQSGKYFLARIFSVLQTDKGKEHLAFTWRIQETPKQVVELLEAVRQKR
jgi:hypothetical protein